MLTYRTVKKSVGRRNRLPHQKHLSTLETEDSVELVRLGGRRHRVGQPGWLNGGGALESFATLVKRRAVVFLVSDFFDSGFERQIKVAGKRHDLIVLPLTDPVEAELPAGVPKPLPYRLTISPGRAGVAPIPASTAGSPT